MSAERRASGTGRFGEEQRKLKEAGNCYSTRDRKNIIPAKKNPNLQLTCKCKFDCKKIPYKQRSLLFKKYYATSESIKGTYLMGLLSISRVKRRRNGKYNHPNESHRQATIYYTLPDGKGDVTRVCKATFMDTFALTKKKLETIIQKKKMGDTVYKDKRTRTAVGKFSDQERQLVREHINSIPRDESHYSRAKSSKEYISPDLNVNRLHKAFLCRHPDSSVTYKFYKMVMEKDFPNVSFRPPRTDTCRKCDRLNCEIKSENDHSKQAKLDLELHHRKSEKAIKEMRDDISQAQMPNSNTSVLSIDLQQVLFIPSLTHSDMFYLSQLSCYNLCINLADIHHSYMCFWHEGVAGRGGNEVASCLLRVINTGLKNKKNLTVWSDNCGAQNKNRMIVFVYMFLVSHRVFDSIEHKYLVSGHSYLQCDRDFALIEKRKKRCKPMVPEDLHEVITSSSHMGKFEVVDMCNTKFFDIKSAADEVLDLKKVNISKVVHMKVDAKFPGILYVKESLSDLESWRQHSVLKKGKKIQDLQNINLVELKEVNKISENKKKHLASMIPYLQKKEHQEFYETLIK